MDNKSFNKLCKDLMKQINQDQITHKINIGNILDFTYDYKNTNIQYIQNLSEDNVSEEDSSKNDFRQNNLNKNNCSKDNFDENIFNENNMNKEDSKLFDCPIDTSSLEIQTKLDNIKSNVQKHKSLYLIWLLLNLLFIFFIYISPAVGIICTVLLLIIMYKRHWKKQKSKIITDQYKLFFISVRIFKRIKHLHSRITNEVIKLKVQNIINVFHNILSFIAKDKAKSSKLSTFMNYITLTEKILQTTVRILPHKSNQVLINEIETTLDNLHKIYIQFYNKLINDSIDDMKIILTVTDQLAKEILH